MATASTRSRSPKKRTGAVPNDLHVCSPATNKKVAIFGGAFDPITNGHLLQAAEIIHAQLADEVWIVPCGVRPDKPTLQTAYMHRLHMCHLAVNTTFGANFPLRVCEIEMSRERAFKTYDLISMLEKEYPDKEFYFAFGSDNYDGISNKESKGWEKDSPERQADLLNKKFIVFVRPGVENLPAELPSNFVKATPKHGTIFSSMDMSSTEVRRRAMDVDYGDNERAAIEKGEAWMIDGLVPSAVMAHIVRYKLYARDRRQTNA